MKIIRLYIRHWVKNQYRIPLLCLNGFLLILISILFFSCRKEAVPSFTNCVISGYTDIWQTSGGENPAIQITATGPYGKVVSNTGESGSFQFTGLGEGTYSLDFYKKGYGIVKMYGIQLFGNDTAFVRNVSLFEKIDFQMPEFTKFDIVKITDNLPYIGVGVIIETNKNISSQIPNPLPVVVFFDSLKSVSYKRFARVDFRVISQVSESGGKINFGAYVFDPPFRKGTTVYFQAYVANPTELYYGYFDNYLGFGQYSTLIPERHSPVMSFVMP
jgi:hypothetical protein